MRVPPRSAVALAACALLVLAFAPAQYFGRQQDDVLYLIGARALSLGRYCLLTSPGCPPLTMINPAWPALLAPLAFFTEDPGPFQAASALVLALVPLALWAWLRRRAGEAEALLAAGLFASSPLVLAQAGAVMSEAPFTLALIALVAASESGRALPAGLAAAALLLTRTAGVSALAALAVFLRPPSPRALLPPVLALGAWSFWSYSRIGAVDKFSMFSLSYGEDPLWKLARLAWANARFYAVTWGGSFTPPPLAGGAAAVLIGAALAAVAAAGAVRALRRRPSEPAALALAGTVCMLGVWGWQYERYMIPLLPLLLWALISGLGRRAKHGLAALLVLQLLMQTLPRLGRPSPWGQVQLAKTYAWLSARPGPNLLVSGTPVRDGWYAGMPNLSFPIVERDEDFAAALKRLRVTLILSVEGQNYGLEADETALPRRQVEQAYRRLRDERYFRKLHEEPSERATVYEPR